MINQKDKHSLYIKYLNGNAEIVNFKKLNQVFDFIKKLNKQKNRGVIYNLKPLINRGNEK